MLTRTSSDRAYRDLKMYAHTAADLRGVLWSSPWPRWRAEPFVLSWSRAPAR